VHSSATQNPLAHSFDRAHAAPFGLSAGAVDFVVVAVAVTVGFVLPIVVGIVFFDVGMFDAIVLGIALAVVLSTAVTLVVTLDVVLAVAGIVAAAVGFTSAFAFALDVDLVAGGSFVSRIRIAITVPAIPPITTSAVTIAARPDRFTVRVIGGAALFGPFVVVDGDCTAIGARVSALSIAATSARFRSLTVLGRASVGADGFASCVVTMRTAARSTFGASSCVTPSASASAVTCSPTLFHRSFGSREHDLANHASNAAGKDDASTVGTDIGSAAIFRINSGALFAPPK
jgi:hypothetical protein